MIAEASAKSMHSGASQDFGAGVSRPDARHHLRPLNGSRFRRGGIFATAVDMAFQSLGTARPLEPPPRSAPVTRIGRSSRAKTQVERSARSRPSALILAETILKRAPGSKAVRSPWVDWRRTRGCVSAGRAG